MGCAVIDAIRDTMIKYHNITYWWEVLPICNSAEDKVYWPGDSLYVIDCQNDSIIKDFDYIISNLGFASWSNHLYITSDTWIGGYPQGILRVLDCRNDSLIANLVIGPGAIWITNNTQYQRTYIATAYDSAIYVIRDEVPGIKETRTLDAEHLTPEIYPNPAKSVVRVRGSLSGNIIKIFDIAGKMIKEIATTASQSRNDRNDKIKISLEGINPGIYFFRLGKETKKFLVVK